MSERLPSSPAWITGMGAVTSVGLGARAACAAIRAGVSRPTPFPDLEILDEETHEPMPLTAHPVAGYTDGFAFMGRWLRLARGAAADLLRSGAVPGPGDAAFWAATAVLAATAAPDDEIFLPEEPGGAAAMLRDGFLLPLESLLGIPLASRNVEGIPAGRTGVVRSVRLALDRLAAGTDRVLVLSVDSLLEPLGLQRLSSQDRLKTPSARRGSSRWRRSPSCGSPPSLASPRSPSTRPRPPSRSTTPRCRTPRTRGCHRVNDLDGAISPATPPGSPGR